MRGPTLSSSPAALIAVALLVTAGCPGPGPAPVPRDVLLVTLDTARADHFSWHSAAGPGTPRVDALARAGAGFRNAISPVPLTLPAHASLFTGRQPPSHTVRDNGAYRLPGAETTLAEVLAAAGFATAAFVGAEVLDRRYGLDQGFAFYDDAIADRGSSTFLYYPERNGDSVVDRTADWLADQGDGPLFVWVHLFDPHVPYRPPEPERTRHGATYAGEIAYVDRVVGRLLDLWEQRRGLQRTLVVVTADHGEALGEHGESTHGVLVHDATLRVPLVLHGPGIRAGTRLDAPVHLVDVMPTILGQLGLRVPEGTQGRDLAPLLRGDTLAWSDASGYAESLYAQLHHGCAPLFALRDSRFKLVRGATTELYDLVADPAESRDLARLETQRAADFGEALDDLQAELAGTEPERIALDEASRRALESLGYVWSSPRPRAGQSSCDPREALAAMGRMADADRRLVRGDVEGAIDDYRDLIADAPASVDARVRLAQILIDRQRPDEAVSWLAEALALAPHEPLLHRKLGRTLESLGRFREALAVFDTGLALHPDERGLRDGRWRCLNQFGQEALILTEARDAIVADPRDATARYARAIACCGQPVEAYVAALERELAELPGDPLLQRALAAARAEVAGR